MIDYKFKSIAGAGGGGDSGGGSESPDTLQSKSMVSILDLLGEGKIGGLVNGAKSIYLDGTVLQNSDNTWNFDQAGVSWESRNGTQDQSYMTAFSSVETPFGAGVRVKTTTPYSITINNANVDRVRVVLNFPALMVQSSDGNINGTSVSYRFMIKVGSAAFVQAAAYTVNGKSRSKYQRSHIIELPKTATNWIIRVERVSADSASTLISDESWVDSWTEITDLKLSYPNSALVGMTVDSSYFSGVPSRGYLVDGLYINVPSNYDPVARTYAGNWDGTFKVAVSNNPAWILFDLLVNTRYGLGQYISAGQVDKAKLYEIGKYCDVLVSDGLGGMEPRFTINAVVSQSAEAYRLISDICAVFRGMAFWNGSSVGFMQDAPYDSGMIFSQANAVNGVFSYIGSGRKDRHSVVLVTWNDPSEDYKQKTEYVEDATMVAKFGIRKLELMAFGCTSRAQAVRVGRWSLFTEQYESDMVIFNVGIDAALCLPGDVVKIHDQYRAGKRLSGRIQSSTTTSIILDAPLTLAKSGALVSLRLADGTFVDRTLTNGAGTYTTLNFSTPISSNLPLPNSMFIVTEPDLKPMLARIMSIGQGDKPTEFVVSAIEHNPGKYAVIEQGLTLEPRQVTVLDPNAVNMPTNLTLTESVFTYAPGVYGLSLDAAWEGREKSYTVTWRKTLPQPSNYTSYTTTYNNFRIDAVTSGTYEVSVVANNFIGVSSQPITVTKAVVADSATPADVTGLTMAGAWVGQTCKANWTAVTFAKDYMVEVWAGGTMRRREYVTDITYEYTAEAAIADGGPWRSIDIKVKARSYQGLTSVNWATVTASNPQVTALQSVDVSAGFLSVNVVYTAKPTDTDFAGVQIWLDTTAGFTPSATNLVYDGKDTNVTILMLQNKSRLVGGQTYYMKIAGYDTFGKDGMTPSVAVACVPISVSGGITPGEINAAMIAGGVLDISKFATGIEPVGIVSSLPSVTGYTGPKVVLFNGKIYKLVSGAWTSATDVADVVGNFTPAQITTKKHMII
jgi:predicted phage tail protein